MISKWHRSLLGLALIASPVAAQEPTTRPASKGTYVLVHGAWAGGWEWKGIGERLTAAGWTVYRPTLTGQGERVHLADDRVDANLHVTDVVNTILFEDLHDVVLMGHSYGGVVVTGVVDRVPERIKAVVYVDAFVPEDGESANAVRGRPATTTAPTTGPAFLNPAGWPYPPDRKPPYIVPMATKAFATVLSLKNPAARRVPATYILTVDPGKTPEQDMFFQSYQRAKARGWAAWVMEADHVPHLSKPAELMPLLERAPVEAKAQDRAAATQGAAGN